VDCCGDCSHGRAWLVNCCQAGRDSSAGGSADQAVLAIAGCELGVSAGGSCWLASPLCQASVVERQPCEPLVERHSVVCRQRAPVARHSAVSVRQPMPSAGKVVRPVEATSDQRLAGSTACSSGSDCCAHASARRCQARASGLGSMLPVSVNDCHFGSGSAKSVRSGLWEGHGCAARRSRGMRAP